MTVWTEYHMRWGPQPSFPSWAFFETKKAPPPYTWPNNETVSLAHTKRAIAAAVIKKTEPLIARNKELEEENARLKQQLLQLQGRPHLDVLLASPRHGNDQTEAGSVSDATLPEATAGDGNAGGVGVDVDADEDEEDWVALAEGGGTYSTTTDSQTEAAADTEVSSDGTGELRTALHTQADGVEVLDKRDDPLGDIHSASDDEAAEAIEDDVEESVPSDDEEDDGDIAIEVEITSDEEEDDIAP